MDPRVEIRGLVGGTIRTDMDPVFLQLGRLRDEMRRFNRTQPKVVIVLEGGELERHIRDSLQRTMDLARRLAREPWEGRTRLSPPAPTVTCVLVALDKPVPGWVAGAGGVMSVASFPGIGSTDEVRVKVVQGVASESHGGMPLVEIPSDFDYASTFGLELTHSSGESRGDLHFLISELLGYRQEDLWFRWPEE